MTEYSFYSGAFTEWTTFFVYASDVFLIFACAFWLISIFKNSFYLDKKSKYLNNKFKKVTKLPKVWLLLLAFLVWVILNLAINSDYLKISVFQTVKLIELSLLVIFVYFNLKNSKILFNSLFVLVFSGFLQSLIAIYQFIAQHSVFTYPILAKITGESIISPQIPGVAKIIVDGEKIIRAYGTFPHPNILGGFLIFTTLITICLYLEHKKGILSSKLRLRIHPEGEQTLVCLCMAQISKFSRLFQYNNTNSVKSQGIAYSLLWITLIFTQITALFFTFSRTAWTGFLLSLLIMIIFYFYNHKIVSPARPAGGRETISKINNNVKNTIIKFKELLIVFLLLICLIVSNFSIIQARIGGDLLSSGRLPDNSAISERNFYNNVSRETISENFVFGSGLGTYIFQIDDFVRNKEINQILQPWQYQPAHNIYLLIASEVGVTGLIFFLLFVFCVISNSFKNRKAIFNSNSIVSRETIEKSCSSLDKGRLGGVYEKSQNYGLKSKIKSIFSFFLNIFTLRYFKTPQPPLSGRLNYSSDKGRACPERLPNGSGISTFGKGGWGNSEKSQNCNLKSDKIVSPACRTGRRETILDIKKLNYYLLAILISFLFIGLFDHYFWTLQQGRLMFWLILGLILANGSIMSKENKY